MLAKWSILTNLMDVLKLPFDVTMGLQHSAFTMSDFYGDWLRMTRKLEQLSSQAEPNPFAHTLLEKIKQREPALMNNSAMLAAVYLDPRYRFQIGRRRKQNRQNHPY